MRYTSGVTSCWERSDGGVLGHRSVRPAWRTRALAALLSASALAPTTALAQQSIFNVPATMGTREGTLFVQEQLNLGERGESNLTLDYGLPEGLEVGLNVFAVGLYDVEHAVDQRPMFLANAAWTADPTSWLRVQLGVQAGVRTPMPEAAQGAVLGWATMRLRGGVFGDYVIGMHAATDDYLGPGTQIGVMAGLEIPVVPEVLALAADFLYGTNHASVGVAGLVILLPDGFQLSLGAQFPSPLSPNAFGGVFELTRVP